MRFLLLQRPGRAMMELDNGVLKESENWIPRTRETFSTSKHNVITARSPKLLVYETDFGWGRLRKTEVAHISCN
ncbi:hypothetical protein GQ457_02G020100 [Hibiscus cannabinus]